MELQLCLALPVSHSDHDHVKGFDLNNCNGLKFLDKKRRFEEACGESIVEQTLPLLLWSGQPNEDDDGDRNRISCKLTKRGEEGGGGGDDQVVGWPPIKSWRRKLLQDQQNHHGHDQGGHREALGNPRTVANNGGPGSESMYVKVKMEGVGITRKIDLSKHSTYETLTNYLISMFDKYSRCSDDKHYTLTYQDKDGDWLLAGDVPWLTFLGSVKRLEIVKKDKSAKKLW